MINRRHYFFIVILSSFLVFGRQASFAQTQKIDSLKTQLTAFDAKYKMRGTALGLIDTLKIKILNELTSEYLKSNPNDMLPYAKAELVLSEKIDYKIGIANANNALGVYYDFKSNYPVAMDYYEKALKIKIERKDKIGQIDLYNNIGVLYTKIANYPMALENLLKGLAISKQANDIFGIFGSYNNIGVLYKSQKNYDAALKNYFNCLSVQKKMRDINFVGVTYYNIGDIYVEKNQYEKAINYYNLALKAADRSGDLTTKADAIEGVGLVYQKKKNFAKALSAFSEALAIRQKIGYDLGVCNSLIYMGHAYLQTGNLKKAIDFLERGLALIKKTGELDLMPKAYQFLSEAYEADNDFKRAYKNHLLFKKIDDSIFNAENAKKLVEQQMTYEFNSIQQKKDAMSKAAIQRQKDMRNYGISGSIVSGFLVVFLLVRRHKKRSVRKQKIYDEELETLQEKITIKDIEAKALQTANENIRLKNELIVLENESEKAEKEKLQEKLDFNARELASTTLYLFEKNKMLSELQNEIDALPKSDGTNDGIVKVKSAIQRNLYLDADWEKFRLHFEQVHPDFFSELNQKHPGLTAYEVRLYAYLHMKLATKEIAALLNITPASVIKAKVRLNKKLRISNGSFEDTKAEMA